MACSSGRGRAGPNVAFDVTTLVGARTGVGRAVVESYRALAKLADPPTLIPFAFGVATLRARRSMPPRTRIVPLPTRALVRAWSFAEHPRLDAALRPARLIHATSFVAPPSRLPLLVTVHDCAFALYPETVTPAVRAFGPILRRAVRRGARIHCTTRAVAAEVEDLFGQGLLAGGRIAVVPFGIPDLGPAQPVSNSVFHQIQGVPYVLALGRLEPRKNLPRLVRAFGAVASRHPDLRLVLAGPDGPDRPAVDEAVWSLEGAVRERVVVTGAVSDAVRRSLIEGAAVLAYPSLYEGFGFPMLEAMTLGVPVVTVGTGGLREVADDAAHVVDPLDADSISAGLDLLLTNESRRRELVALGRERAKAFTWKRTAQGLNALYREMAATSGRG